MSTMLTGSAVDMFADNMALNALAIEINTGMQLTRYATGLEALRTRGLIEGRTTKRAGLRKAVKAMRERHPEWTPGKSVQEALDAK